MLHRPVPRPRRATKHRRKGNRKTGEGPTQASPAPIFLRIPPVFTIPPNEIEITTIRAEALRRLGLPAAGTATVAKQANARLGQAAALTRITLNVDVRLSQNRRLSCSCSIAVGGHARVEAQRCRWFDCPLAPTNNRER